ncbi:MAG: hypothetical protein KGJ77_07455, partial [Acidobacteriota bacterium]|nr:hypothetical protein [Acidobacteriota bacterium]
MTSSSCAGTLVVVASAVGAVPEPAGGASEVVACDDAVVVAADSVPAPDVSGAAARGSGAA